MIADLTMSRMGTVEISMAHELDTTIPEIIFVCFLCSSLSIFGLRLMGFVSGFCSQKDRRRPKCYKNGEVQVNSSEIPKFSRSWLVWGPCRVF